MEIVQDYLGRAWPRTSLMREKKLPTTGNTPSLSKMRPASPNTNASPMVAPKAVNRPLTNERAMRLLQLL